MVEIVTGNYFVLDALVIELQTMVGIVAFELEEVLD
jgi:hypothetical protein